MSFHDNDTSFITNQTGHSNNLLLQTSLWSVRILCPIFIIICPISNWACIRIFQSRIYARSSSKWYFIFIAIFDTIYVLITAPLLFLITLQIYILNQHVLLCKSIVFFNYLSCQISAGLLACLSIDRLIATSCLSLYRQTCTTNFSRMVCLIVIFIFSIVNSHYLIGYSIDSQGFCNIRHYKWYETNYSRLNVVYLLSYSIIPFTIITICNIFIVLSVCQNKTNMKKKYVVKKSPLPSLHAEHSNVSKGSIKLSKKSDEAFQFDEVFNESQMQSDVKHVLFTSIKNEKVFTNLLEAQSKFFSNL